MLQDVYCCLYIAFSGSCAHQICDRQVQKRQYSSVPAQTRYQLQIHMNQYVQTSLCLKLTCYTRRGYKRVCLLNLFYKKKPRYFETITRNTQDSWTGFTCFSKPCFLYIASTCSCEIFEMNCMCYEDKSPITYDWDVRTIRQSKEKCCFFKQWLLVCYLMYQFSFKRQMHKLLN